MGDGRFGPLFLAHDATGLSVVVRTFAQPFSHGERQRVAYALGALCTTPLEHPAIARPITSGEQDGHLYLVHTYLKGTSLADYVEASGHPPLADVMVRITHLAGALDFAAAAGVLHGALSARDIIFSPDSAGVSGFGLVQALEAAGVPGFHARRDDDLRAFAEITRDLVGIDVPGPFSSALEFAKALQATLAPPESPGVVSGPVQDSPAAPEDVWPSEETGSGPHILEPETAFPAEHEVAGGLDIPLRHDVPAAAFRDEPTLPLPSLSPTMFGAAAAPVPQRSRGWLLVPAFFLIVAAGVLLGFTSGFFAGEPSAPQATTTASSTEPEATSGRTYTDTPLEEAKAPAAQAAPTPSSPAPPSPAGAAPPQPALTQPAPAPAASTPIQTPTSAAPAPAPVAPSAASPAERRPTTTRAAVAEPPHTGPAAMRVESNPMGAQVFIDGKPVGYTPLVVGELTPGTHSVRMQIPGYRTWVNAVTLGPGARERVAASLEQQQ